MIKQLTIRVISVMLMLFSSHIMADLVLSEGGATGAWYNSNRSGEGIYVEIIKIGDGNGVSLAMYSFDENGNQLWLTGTVEIDPSDEVAAVEMFQYDGPVWGPDFDPGDLNTIPFGTITVKFPDCNSALFQIISDTGLQNGSYTMVRLTSIEGVECREPPEPPPTGITSGKWEGPGVCFFVSEDGASIIGGNLSSCNGQAAFDSNLDGLSNELDNCKVTTGCEGVWPIVDGKFTCLNELGEMAIGTFDSNTSASGSAFEPEGGRGEFCTAIWTASP